MYKQHQINKKNNLSKLCSFYITHALNLPHLHGDNITAAEPERGCAGMSLTCNHATLSLYRSPCFLWVSLDPSAALRTVFTCRSEQSSSLFVLKTNFTDTGHSLGLPARPNAPNLELQLQKQPAPLLLHLLLCLCNSCLAAVEETPLSSSSTSLCRLSF